MEMVFLVQIEVSFFKANFRFPIKSFFISPFASNLGMEIALRVGSKSRQVSIDCPIVIEEYLEAAQKDEEAPM